MTYSDPSEVMIITFGNSYDSHRGFCALTDELDEHLVGGKHPPYQTYVYDYGDRMNFDGKEGHVYSFRVPGATRGHFSTNADNVIDDIRLYDNTKRCYESGTEVIFDKYLGMFVAEVRVDNK